MTSSVSQKSHTINWYPGHMLKAKKELQACLKRVDVVLELRDARIPMTSVNPDFEPILRQKKRIVLFNKTGLADPGRTEEWRHYFQLQGERHLFLDVKENRGVKKILPLSKELMRERWERFRRKGITPPPLKLLVVGIPNVGKSSLINRMVRRNAAQTGPMPGVTKQQEWVMLSEDVELLDTPGILWPKFESEEAGYRLAVTGAIKDSVVGEERLGEYLIGYFQNNYPERLLAYYRLLPETLAASPLEILHAIALKRGCLKNKGQADMKRAADLLLRDFRAGHLGPVSFDVP